MDAGRTRGKQRATNLYTVIAVRVTQKLLQPRAVQQLPNEHLPGVVFRNPNALRFDSVSTVQQLGETLSTAYLLDDVGTELLDRQRADIASELADNSIAETVVVQVENVLHNLGVGKPFSNGTESRQ